MLFLYNPFWFKLFELKKNPFHYIRFEKGTRYYEFRLSQDLFGDWIIILSNGRIKTKLGKSTTQVFSNYEDALTQLYALIKIRFQKSYELFSSIIEGFIFLLAFYHVVDHFSSKQNSKSNKRSVAPIKANKPVIQKNNEKLQLSLIFNT